MTKRNRGEYICCKGCKQIYAAWELGVRRKNCPKCGHLRPVVLLEPR